MTALIITGGDTLDKELILRESKGCKIIICADSGYDSLIKTNLKPDILIGDFDSIKNLDNAKLSNLKIEKHPIKKDETDTELAIRYAIKNNFKNIKVLGGYGTRADHSLINIDMLQKLYNENINCCIINNNNKIFYCESKLEINDDNYDYISLIPTNCDKIIVNGKNLLYELDNLTIEFGTTLGISNKIKAYPAEIEILFGQAYIILSKD